MIQTFIFAAIIAVICLTNYFWKFDPSIGETQPHLADKAAYPKAYVHSVSAFAAMMVMLMFHTPYIAAILLLELGICGYEWSQGFINKFDILAGNAGMLLAIILWLTSQTLY